MIIRRLTPFVIGIAILVLGTAGRAQVQKQAPNTLWHSEASEGWRLLFDGKTIDQWRGFRETGVPAGWTVVDGALTRVDASVDLISIDEFGSFDFKFDWQVTPGANSGVMYHVSEAEESTYHTGPEYQVLDNAGHEDGKSPLTSAAACYALYPPSRDVTRPVGEWNEGRILVNGSHVEHWLNGVKLVEYELGSADWNAKVKGSKFNEWPPFGKAARGHLALQDHGDRVAYRNLKVKPL
jgi:hypothetical protein